ncbi:hypothetical protein K8T06_14625, partial [bacterium]|nr:hypothetical protein [bacterium]
MSAIEVFEKSARYLDHMSSDLISYPEKLLLELTTRQQPDCRCPLPLSMRQISEEKDISDDLLGYIQTSILPYMQCVHLTGRGDALLAEKQLLSTLDAAKEFSVPIIIDTHGIGLANEVIFNKILDSPVVRLNIMLNAPDDKHHKEICGCALSEIENALEKFHVAEKSGNIKIPEICLKMVAVASNIELLPEMIAFAQKHHVSKLLVVPMSLSEDPDEISAFRYCRELTEEVMYRSLIESEMKGFTLETEPEQLMDAMGTVKNIEHFLAGQIPPDPESNQWIRDCSCIWNHAILDVD